MFTQKAWNKSALEYKFLLERQYKTKNVYQAINKEGIKEFIKNICNRRNSYKITVLIAKGKHRHVYNEFVSVGVDVSSTRKVSVWWIQNSEQLKPMQAEYREKRSITETKDLETSQTGVRPFTWIAT